jgi:membrane protein implicated in regulation of membrane protease activity
LEVDGDLGAEVEPIDIGGSGFGDAFGSVFASLLSFRTVVFFSAFFGTSGLVFSALDYSPATSLITAIVVGVIAALINSTLFGLIKNSQANSQISDSTLEGRPARVVLPMTSTQRGRIRIDLSGQPQYMVAQPMDDGSGQQFDVGASVVVVKIENGTALVASLAELDSGEE